MSKKQNAKQQNAVTVVNATKVNSTKDKTVEKSLTAEQRAEQNAKRIFDILLKEYNAKENFVKSFLIESVKKVRAEKKNACMYDNDYTRVNFIATADKTHAYFYVRIKQNSIYLVVNEKIYNATKESVKTLITKEYIKYNKQSKTENKIKIVKYYVTEQNLTKVCDIVINAYANINA